MINLFPSFLWKNFKIVNVSNNVIWYTYSRNMNVQNYFWIVLWRNNWCIMKIYNLYPMKSGYWWLLSLCFMVVGFAHIGYDFNKNVSFLLSPFLVFLQSAGFCTQVMIFVSICLKISLIYYDKECNYWKLQPGSKLSYPISNDFYGRKSAWTLTSLPNHYAT